MQVLIYIVSLLRDTERRDKIQSDFSRLGIDFQFFDAVDAKDPKNKALIEQARLSGVGHDMTDGEIACTLSHQFIYQKMISSNNDWIIILEDDVEIDERFKTFCLSFNEDEQKKLPKDNLYLLGGQKGLHSYPVLGVSRFSVIKAGNLKFGRINYNREKLRRTCCYLMNKTMAKQFISLTENYGTYRADSWELMSQEKIIKEFYLNEIIFHPIVTPLNSHLELERSLISGQKKSRGNIQGKMKFIRSWLRVSFFSFFK